MTDYYELYREHGLPLEEAYYLAEYKFYITEDPSVKDMANALRKEICDRATHPDDEKTEDICRRYMKEKGYYEERVPFIFQPYCDFYGNYSKPDDQRIRNKIDYLELYNKGLVSLRETYVLAKNKNYLLYDNSMLGMVFAIEDEIFKELIENPVFTSSKDDPEPVKRTMKYIEEHLAHKPRTQINGCSKPVGKLIYVYMADGGYTYERVACNSFLPMIKRVAVVDLIRMAMPVKGVKFYGPSTEDELTKLEDIVSDELILNLYRMTAGCILVNDYGEIHLYSIKDIISKATGKNTYIGLIPSESWDGLFIE